MHSHDRPMSTLFYRLHIPFLRANQVSKRPPLREIKNFCHKAQANKVLNVSCYCTLSLASTSAWLASILFTMLVHPFPAASMRAVQPSWTVESEQRIEQTANCPPGSSTERQCAGLISKKIELHTMASGEADRWFETQIARQRKPK